MSFDLHERVAHEQRTHAARPTRELVDRYLVDRFRGLVSWAIGLSLYALLIVAFFPTIRDSESFAAAVEDYPDAMKEFLGGDAAFELTTGPGFVNAEIYSLMLPLLLSFVAVGMGASMGGDQQSGLMDLVLANPIRRSRVVIAKTAAMFAAVTVLTAIVGTIVLVAGSFVELEVGVNDLVATSVATILLVTLHGLFAVAVGAATGQRAMAIGAAVASFAVGYILNGLGGLVGWLEPFRVLSPYHHSLGVNPLVDGWAVGNLAVLALLCAAVFAVALGLFERRDLA